MMLREMYCALFELYEICIVLPATKDVRQFRSRNCPQYFGTGPIDQGGTRHGGFIGWISRTSAIDGRISRTLVSSGSLSELYLPRESASCQKQGESAVVE
jgi:hypothetical protein